MIMPQRSTQPSLLRIGILALLCCAVTGISTAPAFGAAEAEEAASENASEQVFLPLNPWGPHAESTVYALSYIEEDEPDGTRLQGISLLWSSWDETVDFSGGLGVWLSAQKGDSQTVIGAGAEVTLYPWVFQAPVRFGPRFRLGVEHRRRDPDRPPRVRNCPGCGFPRVNPASHHGPSGTGGGLSGAFDERK